MRRRQRLAINPATTARPDAPRWIGQAARRPVVASMVLLPMALLMCGPAAAADEKVGVNAAVNPAGTGTLPSGPTRQLMIGQDVVFKERVNTTAAGQTQIMFLDQSSMSVGPNSDMVIDEFVYDPNANTGKVAMSATRGVFRYVGGKISKLEGGASVDTPVASIGIRGGAFLMRFDHNQLDIVFIYGKSLAVTGRNGVTKIILRPGYRITVGPDGNPSDPYKAAEDFIAALSAALDGRAGGNGGAREIPTDQRVIISGIGNVISAQFEANLLEALRAAGFTCTGGVGLQAIANRLAVRCSTSDDPGNLQTAFTENDVIQRKFRRVNEPQPPAPGPYVGSFNSVAATSATGFTGAPVTFSGGTLTNGVFTVTIGGSTVSLGPLTPGAQSNVTGQAPFGPVSGTAFLSSDGSYFYANLSGEGQVALIQGGFPITDPAKPVGTPKQVLAFDIQQDPALRSAIPFIRNSAGGNIRGATVSPLYLVTPSGNLTLDPRGLDTSRTLQASLGISGTGPGQQSVLVTSIGFINDAAPQLIGALRGTSQTSGTPLVITGGVNSTPDGVGGGLYGSTGISGIALGSDGAAETRLNGATTSYNFNNASVATATPANVGPGLGAGSSGFIPKSGYFGGLMFSNQGSPYTITGTNTFKKTGPATFSANFLSDFLPSEANGPTNIKLTFGGEPGATPNSTIIDGNIYGATEAATGATLERVLAANTFAAVAGGGGRNGFPGRERLYLLSGAAAPLPDSIITGGNLCSTCAFAQWGYWGGEVTSKFAGTNRVDLGNINFWVAGQPTVTLPTSGFGSYKGNAVGVANNNGAQYIASGTFTNDYDFGALSGIFQLNFDGKNLRSFVNETGRPGGEYAGNLVDTATFGSSLSGQVRGKFFGPTTVVPPETGGNFSFQSISGAPYSAGGVFLGTGKPCPTCGG